MAVKKQKHEMPEQKPEERIKNFNEVPYGYPPEVAIEEAKRCIQCKNRPCTKGCPVEIDIPEFIKEIAKGDFAKAVEVLKSKTSLPAVCGRVCPYENQCEGNCTLLKLGESVGIGRLERFLADWERENGVKEPKKVKPTGKSVAVIGAGPAGLTCAGDLAKKGHKVICLDNFNDYYDPEIKRKNIKKNLENPNFVLEEKDITNFEELKKVFSKYEIKKIIHLAARAGVRPSIKQPQLYFDVNVKGTQNLLELSRKNNVRTFVFGSSSSVYGNNKEIPFSENHRTEKQISPYASSKKCAEILCKSYSKLFNINITCLRFFTVYGERGRPDMAPYKFTDLIFNDKTIEMYGDGTSKRDYTYVKDIVQGIISALEKNLEFEIINLGNSDPIELKEFISIIENTVGKTAKIIQKPIPPGDVNITYADITKAKKLLSYKPETDIRQGIKKMFDWYKNKNS